jgi:tetratricopeptide (TPR) repeat protein
MMDSKVIKLNQKKLNKLERDFFVNYGFYSRFSHVIFQRKDPQEEVDFLISKINSRSPFVEKQLKKEFHPWALLGYLMFGLGGYWLIANLYVPSRMPVVLPDNVHPAPPTMTTIPIEHWVEKSLPVYQAMTLWTEAWQDWEKRFETVSLLDDKANILAENSDTSVSVMLNKEISETWIGIHTPFRPITVAKAAPAVPEPSGAVVLIEAPALAALQIAPPPAAPVISPVPVVAQVSVTPQVVKRLVHNAHQEEGQIQQIDALRHRGDLLGAIAKARKLYQEHPTSVPIVTQLGNLYLDSNQTDSFQKLWGQLDEQVLAAFEIKLLEARFYLLEEEPKLALAVLNNMSMVGFNPLYFGLLAATYQKLGQHDKAVEVYWDIVQRHPEDGQSWAGLSVSLEAIRDKPNAILGYRRALYYPLNAELRQYVESRLSSLDR